MLQPTGNLELLALLWVVLLLSATAVGLLLAIGLLKPLRRLSQATRQLAQGQLDIPVEVKGSQEVTDLASSVKAIATNLAESREQLSATEARYQTIVETMNEGVMLLGPEQRITFCNGRMGMMTGRCVSEIMEKPTLELLPESRREEFQNRLGLSPSTFETELLDASGNPWPALIATAPINDEDHGSPHRAILAVVADLREVQRLRQQAESAERLAIVGRLASTLAHELRNPLGVISNSVYFLKMHAGQDDEKVRRHLDILRNQVTVATHIIEQLLDYARPKEPVTAMVKLSRLVEVALTQTTIPDSIQVVKSLDQPGLEVMVDPELMQRVFWNLIQNAVQAMPDGGTLDVAIHPNGNWVAVTVRDTGHGITAANMTRLFEPLFTTKAKGTGLGLAVSKATVEKHGGTIEVASTPGQGTTFTVKLPRPERKG